MSSIFSRIVASEIPCHRVWEDERHLAFLDVNPQQPGHTLVIPKTETDYLFDLDADAHAALWTAAHTVARHLKTKLACARVCVGVWGYEVPHAHIHLVPTKTIDDFMPPPARGGSDQAELAAMAARLAS